MLSWSHLIPRRVLAALVVLAACTAASAEFSPGNLLVMISRPAPTESEVHEYTPAGAFVQAVIVPANPTAGTESGRDMVLDDSGFLHVFNGTFDPLLSTFDGVLWDEHGFAEWSTANVVSYGGIAATGPFVYVTDMITASDPAHGIVRFDTSKAGYPAARFADSEEYTDLNIGLDCLLYGLRQDEDTVDVFEPLSMAPLGTVLLDNGVSGVAVDANGDIFGASWDGNIYRFDATGTQLDFVASGSNFLTDINLDADGNLVAGSWFGDVIQTTAALPQPTVFNVDDQKTFVAHVSGDQCDLEIFADGFESGDTSAWSNTVP